MRIQRRKTIHDIINFDLINNLISNASFSTNNTNKTPSTDIQASSKSQSSIKSSKLSKNHSHILTDKTSFFNTIDKSKTNVHFLNENTPSRLVKQQSTEPIEEVHINRELVFTQGPVQLLNVLYICFFLLYFGFHLINLSFFLNNKAIYEARSILVFIQRSSSHC